MKKFNNKEIEDIGLRFLREHNNKKLLSNVNLDCFIYGFKKSQDLLMNHPSFGKDFLEWCYQQAGDRIDFINESAGYGGRCLTDEERKETNLLCAFRNDITKALEKFNK